MITTMLIRHQNRFDLAQAIHTCGRADVSLPHAEEYESWSNTRPALNVHPPLKLVCHGVDITRYIVYDFHVNY
jgi:hypothetical protein